MMMKTILLATSLVAFIVILNGQPTRDNADESSELQDAGGSMQCTFKPGDGIGGKEIKIGAQKGFACILECYKRSLKDHAINGATVYRDTSKGGCWCEKNMKGRNKNTKYQTCFFAPVQCLFKPGDGTGGKEIKIGAQKGRACIDACYKRSMTDHAINGATVYSNTDLGGCWCEKNMKGRNKNTKYKTCTFGEEENGFTTTTEYETRYEYVKVPADTPKEDNDIDSMNTIEEEDYNDFIDDDMYAMDEEKNEK